MAKKAKYKNLIDSINSNSLNTAHQSLIDEIRSYIWIDEVENYNTIDLEEGKDFEIIESKIIEDGNSRPASSAK